jgi:hypothetical protein
VGHDSVCMLSHLNSPVAFILHYTILESSLLHRLVHYIIARTNLHPGEFLRNTLDQYESKSRLTLSFLCILSESKNQLCWGYASTVS